MTSGKRAAAMAALTAAATLGIGAPVSAQPSGPAPEAAPSPYRVPPPAPGPARPRAPLQSYIGPADYPAAAGGAEGTARVRLEIDSRGRVSACAVTASTGSPALDTATCRILQRRARFTPAHDAEGRPVADAVEARIVWRRGG